MRTAKRLNIGENPEILFIYLSTKCCSQFATSYFFLLSLFFLNLYSVISVSDVARELQLQAQQKRHHHHHRYQHTAQLGIKWLGKWKICSTSILLRDWNCESLNLSDNVLHSLLECELLLRKANPLIWPNEKPYTQPNSLGAHYAKMNSVHDGCMKSLEGMIKTGQREKIHCDRIPSTLSWHFHWHIFQRYRQLV